MSRWPIRAKLGVATLFLSQHLSHRVAITEIAIMQPLKPETITDPQGLICAYILDGQSRRSLNWESIEQWRPNEPPLWIHLDRSNPNSHRWLYQHSGLEKVIVDSLLKDEVRPRFSDLGNDQILMVVRGINLKETGNPEEMISLRIWSDGKRIITLRHEPLMSTFELRKAIEQGQGPKDIAEYLVRLFKLMETRIEPAVYQLSNQLDAAEDQFLQDKQLNDPVIGEIDSSARTLHRHLTAQRDAFARMRQSQVSWLLPWSNYWREIYHAMVIYVDELNDLAARCRHIQETKMQQLMSESNRTMYLLSIIAGVFLPLSFITGLLGINVGGMPGVNSDSAFWIVCLLIVIVGFLELAFFRWKKWL
jgi:zinc transporter